VSERPEIILGMAGGTASGKTTAAIALAEALGPDCLLVFHDRYYLPLPPAFLHNPGAFNFDHPESLDTSRLEADLDELAGGRSVRMPVYDFSRHDRLSPDQWEDVHPRRVIVVEGFLVLAESGLAKRLTHRVFVDAPADLRLARRIRRDMAERGRTVESVLDQYERTVRPMHLQFVEPSRQTADLVVDGLSPVASVVAAIRTLIGV
jgi:uridine kinase